MPKTSEMLPSRFLRKEDVESELVATIAGCTLELMPGESNEHRWVLSFKELPKGLVLNATIIRVLEKIFGNDSDDWSGKKVVLFVDEGVTFRGQVVGGLRLRPIKPAKVAAIKAAAGKGEDFDDIMP